jgi:hypothetical protein
MPSATVQLLPYVIGVMPLALVSILSVAWWDALARPWVFLVAGSCALYAFVALVIVAVTFLGPAFHGYFLETRIQPGEGGGSVDPLVTTAAIAYVAFLIIGTAILWALKQWLLKP